MSTVSAEFELIRRCFTRPSRQALLGIGDDAALIAPTPGQTLAISTDALVEGIHFLADAEPESLGWKTLAVNVSDLAAMGATPRWATLAAVLPAPTFAWVEAFARGFFACADAFDIELIGGDTTRGPRAFCVTILGEVPAGAALRRDGARVGDSIWVSGAPGRAALGLAHLQGRLTLSELQLSEPQLNELQLNELRLSEPRLSDCLAALQRPQPRVALGLALRGLAHAAIDVSDGLLADLGHILDASRCAARLYIPALPPAGAARDAYLAGGDDYELVFTAPAAQDARIAALADQLALPLTRLGEIVAATPTLPAGALVLHDEHGVDITPVRRGFEHFVDT